MPEQSSIRLTGKIFVNASKSTQECIKICLRKMVPGVTIEGCITKVVQSVTDQFDFLQKNNMSDGNKKKKSASAVSHFQQTIQRYMISYNAQFVMCSGKQGATKWGGECEKGNERGVLSPYFPQWVLETSRCCPSRIDCPLSLTRRSRVEGWEVSGAQMSNKLPPTAPFVMWHKCAHQ